jgi:hypothetical protein
LLEIPRKKILNLNHNESNLESLSCFKIPQSSFLTVWRPPDEDYISFSLSEGHNYIIYSVNSKFNVSKKFNFLQKKDDEGNDLYLSNIPPIYKNNFEDNSSYFWIYNNNNFDIDKFEKLLLGNEGKVSQSDFKYLPPISPPFSFSSPSPFTLMMKNVEESMKEALEKRTNFEQEITQNNNNGNEELIFSKIISNNNIYSNNTCDNNNNNNNIINDNNNENNNNNNVRNEIQISENIPVGDENNNIRSLSSSFNESSIMYSSISSILSFLLIPFDHIITPFSTLSSTNKTVWKEIRHTCKLEHLPSPSRNFKIFEIDKFYKIMEDITSCSSSSSSSILFPFQHFYVLCALLSSSLLPSPTYFFPRLLFPISFLSVSPPGFEFDVLLLLFLKPFFFLFLLRVFMWYYIVQKLVRD